MKTASPLFALLILAACTAPPLSPARAHEVCEARARAAQGPTGSVTIGTNSNSGPFTAAEIGITGDFLAGRDPIEIYESCYFDRTGQAPSRQPELRR